MCTPWTLTRFVRWRVRDWASCFLACRFPLEEEAETHNSSSLSPPLPIRNMVFDTTKDEAAGDKKANKRLPRRKRCRKDRELNPSSPTLSRNTASVENMSDWPRFSDEEYIVFCFREDGGFDVVMDSSKSEESNDTTRSCRLVNRKLNYGEDARANEDGNDDKEITPAKEGDEEQTSICLEVELASSGSLRRRQHHQVEEQTLNRSGGMVSVESRDSNQSDGSRGSFAFPVLGWEWMGSPVQMPKSEGIMSPSKSKAHSVHFHCFRF